jgi:hypothetical protein
VYIIKGFDPKDAGCIGMVLEPYEFPGEVMVLLFPFVLYICNIGFT